MPTCEMSKASTGTFSRPLLRENQRRDSQSFGSIHSEPFGADEEQSERRQGSKPGRLVSYFSDESFASANMTKSSAKTPAYHLLDGGYSSPSGFDELIDGDNCEVSFVASGEGSSGSDGEGDESLLYAVSKRNIRQYEMYGSPPSSAIEAFLQHKWQLFAVCMDGVCIAFNLNVAKETLDDSTPLRVVLGIMLFLTVSLMLMSFNVLHKLQTWKHTGCGLRVFLVYYTSTIVIMATLYHSLLLLDDSCFDDSVHSDAAKSKNHASATLSLAGRPSYQFLLLIYFSTAAQTSAGYGDIYPKSFGAQLCSCSQMLVGLVFSSVMISQTISLIEEQNHVKSAARRSITRRRKEKKKDSCFRRLVRNRYVQRSRRALRKYLLLWTIIVETCVGLILYSKHPFEHGDFSSPPIAYVTVAMQFIIVAVIFIVSFKFVRNTHDITVGYLVQTFLSCCICFGGIYITLFLLTHNSEETFNVACYVDFFDNTTDSNARKRCNRAKDFWTVAFQMLYFSLTTMTTTGFGDIVPLTIAPVIIVVMEMIAGQIFIIVIFGIGVNSLATKSSIRKKSVLAASSQRYSPSDLSSIRSISNR